ncbi:MAG: 4Fe-4S binding protein [Chloroflexota bacterium]
MGPNAMPEINLTVCRRCGACVARCPAGALEMSVAGPVLHGALCSYCGDCEDICPDGAIALPYTIVLRARKRAGGG